MTDHDRLFDLQIIHHECNDTCVMSFIFTRIKKKREKGGKKTYMENVGENVSYLSFERACMPINPHLSI